MAQFSHADFGGMSRWSPGTSMVGDMFNPQLKSKLDALCTDIAAHLASEKIIGGVRSAVDEVSYRSMPGSSDWWPSGLGRPGAVGVQKDLRYAVFPEARRLVIDDRGSVSIFGVAQSRDQTAWTAVARTGSIGALSAIATRLDGPVMFCESMRDFGAHQDYLEV